MVDMQSCSSKPMITCLYVILSLFDMCTSFATCTRWCTSSPSKMVGVDLTLSGRQFIEKIKSSKMDITKALPGLLFIANRFRKYSPSLRKL